MCLRYCIFFFKHTATSDIYPLSLHDALPIWTGPCARRSSSMSHSSLADGSTTSARCVMVCAGRRTPSRSEEHTSELQSRSDLVCRLLLEKKTPAYIYTTPSAQCTIYTHTCTH